MGHERVGVLPKTKRWRAIVTEIASVDAVSTDIPDIARHTLDALGYRYVELATDAPIEAAFGFLVDLARSAAAPRDPAEMGQKSPLTIVAELSKLLDSTDGSRETAEIAKRAAADAIATWANESTHAQEELFADTALTNRWSGLGTAGGFCELTRLFFSRLTGRYLSYFLDREASAALPATGSKTSFRLSGMPLARFEAI